MNTDSYSEQDERISAYLDGELSPEERAEVERLLAEDPKAQRLMQELRAVSQTLRAEPQAAFTTDLSSVVIAEGLKRKEAERVEVAERLEPEGDFGLPFERNSRSWGWAGVAAAAAIMISFFGRPGAAPPRQIAQQTKPQAVQQLDQRLLALQRVNPNVQVVNYNLTPQQLQLLQRRIAPSRQLPVALASAKSAGVVVEPSEGGLAADQDEQLLVVDAEQAQLDRLLAELEQEGGGASFQVGTDRSADSAARQAAAPVASAQAAPGKINAVRINLKVTPEGVVATPAQAAGDSSKRRVVVLRIKLNKQP